MPFTPLVKLLLLVAIMGLSACATTGDSVTRTDGIFDPWEEKNREVHEFNRDLDRALVGPAGRGFSSVVPDVVEDMIGNFSRNVGMPGVLVNSLLQADFETASVAVSRMFVNTIFGVGGLVDTATAFEIPDVDTDFGETLYVWGAAEGPYMELPVLGPSTQRHAIGRFVDLFTNPLVYILDSPESYFGTGADIGRRLSDRGRFSDTVESILYESSDSYAQLRLIYLQNRRFELGQEDVGQEIDPFALETEGF